MKKIMFNDKYKLTYSVLMRMKTMTRRLVPESVVIDGKIWALTQNKDPQEALREYILSKAPYKVGEIVAVAQAYKYIYQFDCVPTWVSSTNDPSGFIKWDESKGYSNKMYVKAEYMPHKIKITDLKLEFIQEISDEDCIKEGIYTLTDDNSNHKPKTVYTYIGGRIFDKPQWAFRSLFIKTSRKRKEWEQNWWTYAYKFELVD